MKLIIAIAVFLIAAIPPPPLGGTLDPVDGVALIGRKNDVQADTVVIALERDDCRGPVLTAVDPLEPQMVVQVPPGPPFDVRCLLTPGDHVYLLRYRDGLYIDAIGPYIVPIKVWLPILKTDTPSDTTDF